MKKLVIFCACLVCIATAGAQSNRLYVGVKGGVNIASLNVENGVDYNGRTSFHAGGLAHFHITQNFAIQHELFYSGQGGKFGSDRLRLGYLNSPLLAQYMTGFGLRFETGPQLGFLLGAKEKNGNAETSIRNQLRPVDFSWVFGTGYLFPGTGFGLDARYNAGISNIHDAPGGIQNRVFSLGMFYQWPCNMHDVKSKKS
jgi:hypothetical protein